MSISDLHAIGRQDGSAKVTLTWADMPPHNHSLQMSTMPATNGAPANAVLGAKGRFGRDLMGPADSNLEASALGSTGGNFAHENMPPYLALTFAIALQGLFPSHW